MVHIAKPINLAPNGWSNICAAEEAKVLAFFRNPKNAKKSFKQFRAYKDVATVLRDLFHKKCAYCETNYAANTAVDVEHFRPKGEITENGKTIKPGYYWLASRWENLLPSCRDCNAQRKHQFPDGRVELLGKKNEFPIANPRKRAKKPGQETEEVPLLIDPSNPKEDPSQHIEFLVDSQGIGLVRGITPKGDQSIRVYALIRPDLVQRRKDHATRVQLGLVGIINALSDLEMFPNQKRFADRLEEQIRSFENAFLLPRHEYLAMTRRLASHSLLPLLRKKRLSRFKPKFASLLKHINPTS